MFESTISEPMTWTQICKRYPDEWVALVEIDWVNDRDFDFRTARVIGQGPRPKGGRRDQINRPGDPWPGPARRRSGVRDHRGAGLAS